MKKLTTIMNTLGVILLAVFLFQKPLKSLVLYVMFSDSIESVRLSLVQSELLRSEAIKVRGPVKCGSLSIPVPEKFAVPELGEEFCIMAIDGRSSLTIKPDILIPSSIEIMRNFLIEASATDSTSFLQTTLEDFNRSPRMFDQYQAGIRSLNAAKNMFHLDEMIYASTFRYNLNSHGKGSKEYLYQEKFDQSLVQVGAGHYLLFCSDKVFDMRFIQMPKEETSAYLNFLMEKKALCRK